MTIQEFKQSAINELTNTSPSPQLDVEVLICFKTGYTKTQLLLNRDKLLTPEQEQWLSDAIQKRKTGLPVAYITGYKEFYGYDFIVSPSVLIPKPDTEILVERAIQIITEKIKAQPNKILSVCDMCTGSGCIGLSVLRTLIDEYKISAENLPKFTLVDISAPALEIAHQNLQTLGTQTLGTGKSVQQNQTLGTGKSVLQNQTVKPVPTVCNNVRFVRSNLFEQVPWSFDVILTNPPYIPHTMVDELLQDGRSEPRLALDGDVIAADDGIHTPGDSSGKNDGLGIIRDLIPQAKEHLAPRGTILMETGEYNSQDTACIAKSWGFKTKVLKDLEGQDRVVEMR